MKKVNSKKVLVLLSLLLFLPLFSGCFLTPSVNQTPTITSTSITTATVKELYVYNVNATDPDSGDTLTYSLTTNPSGMTIDSTTGLINWTPTSAQIGNHNVTVEVSDGSLSDTQSFIIIVSKAPIIPGPPAPAPTPTPVAVTGVTLDQATMTLTAGGATGTLVATVVPANATNKSVTWSSSALAVATVVNGVVTPLTEGTTTITVTTAEGGFTATCEVTVAPPTPNLELTPSTQSVAVGNPVTINILVENVTDLMGANITLNFDATKLQHVSSTAGSFFSLAFVIPTVDNVNGSVTLALLTLAEKPSGTGNIITIVFNPVATDVADITFGTTILRDKNNIDIVHTKGSGCSITIN